MDTTKNILIAISGSIAAYKIAELIRLLKQNNYAVQVAMTENAKQFITPMTIQSLTGTQVRDELFSCQQEATMGHIELARWADSIVVAPASADTIARLAQGRANDLISAICLAAEVPIAIAPAMNQAMWANTLTQTNIKTLSDNHYKIWGPAEGEQACGEVGFGRMLEPGQIFNLIAQQFEAPLLKNKKILITAGPTRESIDPVRYLSNHSSGKMGYAMAIAARDLGAKVTLISGPVKLTAPAGIKMINVISAIDMYKAVMEFVAEQDIVIMAAAVADYRPAEVSAHKIKKSADDLNLKLIRNPDILLEISRLNPRPYLIGFAAETENSLEYAKGKLAAKNLDCIVVNNVLKAKTFDNECNEVVVLGSDGKTKQFNYQAKEPLALHIFKYLFKTLAEEKIAALVTLVRNDG